MSDADDTPSLSLGELVRSLRQRQGLSYRQVGRLAGVNPTWVQRLEQGRYQSPDAKQLRRLAVALGAEPSDLFIAAGFQAGGDELPSFEPYLRSKFALPDEAIQQLKAHFDLIDEKYRRDGRRHRHG